MKLYTMIVAPNPAKVLLYLAERQEAGADLPIERVEINPFEGELNGDAHLARSPFGTVPVLELDDGSYIFESLATSTTLRKNSLIMQCCLRTWKRAPMRKR